MTLFQTWKLDVAGNHMVRWVLLENDSLWNAHNITLTLTCVPSVSNIYSYYATIIFMYCFTILCSLTNRDKNPPSHRGNSSDPVDWAPHCPVVICWLFLAISPARITTSPPCEQWPVVLFPVTVSPSSRSPVCGHVALAALGVALSVHLLSSPLPHKQRSGVCSGCQSLSLSLLSLIIRMGIEKL